MKKVFVGLLSTAIIVTSFNVFTITAEGKSTYQNRIGSAKLLDETYESRVGIAKILDPGTTAEDMIPNYVEKIITIEEEVIPKAQYPEAKPQEVVVEEIKKEEQPVGNRWGIKLSDYEKDLLAKIVWLESGNQSNDGQQAVITVILNRVISNDFPNSVEAVLSQKNPTQFTTWSKLNSATPEQKNYDNINAVLKGDGNSYVTGNNWLYFNGVGPESATQIGDHKFW